MTIKSILEILSEKGILSLTQSGQIFEYEKTKPFSIHWELRAVLYLGITMFTSGLSVLVYKNIDTIGHQAIITLIAILIVICFYYAIRHLQTFSWEEVKHTDKISEFALLLGCTLFLILEGYLQFQYNFFGIRYGIAIFIPTLIFFFLAYRFDHRGVLAMAITGLASGLGLNISPLSIIEKNDFTSPGLIATALVLGIFLCAVGFMSELKSLKKHFGFTYMLFGGNLAAIAGIAGLFNNSPKLVYFTITLLLCTFLIIHARKTQSLIFLLIGTIFGYIVLTYGAFVFLPDSLLGLVTIFYFLFTSIGVLFFLLNVKKILKLKK